MGDHHIGYSLGIQTSSLLLERLAVLRSGTSVCANVFFSSTVYIAKNLYNVAAFDAGGVWLRIIGGAREGGVKHAVPYAVPRIPPLPLVDAIRDGRALLKERLEKKW